MYEFTLSVFFVLLPLASARVVNRGLEIRASPQCVSYPIQLNVTLPDPDPSVNATLQILRTANFSLYQPEEEKDLMDLDTINVLLPKIDYRVKRDSLFGHVFRLFRRVVAGVTSGGRSSGSGVSTSAASRIPPPFIIPVGSGFDDDDGRERLDPVTGLAKGVSPGIGSTTTMTGSTFNAQPASPGQPAIGIPAKAPTIVMGYPIYNTSTKAVSGMRPYYNAPPASQSIVRAASISNYTAPGGISPYASNFYGSYYGAMGYGNSSFGWYPFQYLGVYWWYPSWIYIDNQQLPDNPDFFASNSSGSVVPSMQFSDPQAQNTSMAQGVVTLDGNGTLYAINPKDYTGNPAVHWVPDHLLEINQIELFFNRTDLPKLAGNNTWEDIWYSIKSCPIYSKAVAAILNSPTNLVGLDIVINHLKSLVLLRSNGPTSWTRPQHFYIGLYNYLTIVRPNYLATAQAIDKLIGIMANDTNGTNDIFSGWAAERFDNATKLVVSQLLPK